MQNRVNSIFARTLCCVLTLCMVATLFLTGCQKEPQIIPETAAPTEATVPPTEPPAKEMSVTDLMKATVSVKQDLHDVMDLIGENELENAADMVAQIRINTQIIRESLSATITNLGDSATSLVATLENIQKVLDLVDMAAEKLLLPVIAQLQINPPTQLHTEAGINVRWLGKQLDFAESLLPDLEALYRYAQTVDLSIIDGDGELAEYLMTLGELLDIYHAEPAIISHLKTILGTQEDRTYLLAVQNSAEIRASGGYPGSMGTIRIRDGILTMGEFKPVSQTLSQSKPRGVNLTNEEYGLFNFHSGMQAPRDADLCPDFPRVADIWRMGYEARQKENLDGVIAMTPHIVQRLLAVSEEEMELIEGFVLDKDSATRVLQRDIYFKYYHIDEKRQNSAVPDLVFADAAQKTLQLVTGEGFFSNLIGYFLVAKESFEDRTLMLWMKDEQEQEMVARMDWDGALNYDPENPEIGIYYNSTVPSKIAYFLLIDAQMGEGTQNEDGSCSYPVTVTFTNNMTEEEKDNAGFYITGGYYGAVRGVAYFFAPAGGTVSNFTMDNGYRGHMRTYNGLQLGFMREFSVLPGATVTVTYTVTTAPGVDAVPVFSRTPTAQQN